MDINYKTDADINTILQYLAAGGGIGFGTVALLNALSDIESTRKQKNMDKKINTMAKPVTVVEINPDYIDTKTELMEKKYVRPLKKSLKKLAEENPSVPIDPSKLQSEINPVFRDAVKWVMGAGGLYAGGVLANKLYNWFKRNSLKDELEDAKKQYYSTLYMRKKLEDIEKKKQNKKKSSGMYSYASENNKEQVSALENEGLSKQATVLTNVLGAGLAGVLGLGLMHMIIARNFSKSRNPTIDKEELLFDDLTSSELRSPKLRFVLADGEDVDNGAEKKENIKKTSSEEDSQVDKDVIFITRDKFASILNYKKILLPEAMESIIKLASELNLQDLKNSGINDVITAVALGCIDPLEVESATYDELYKTAEEFCRGTKKIASEARKTLAVSYIVNSPVLREAVLPVAMGEVLANSIAFDKVASGLDQDSRALEDAICSIGISNLISKKQALSGYSAKVGAPDTQNLLKIANTVPNFTYLGREVIKEILSDENAEL